MLNDALLEHIIAHSFSDLSGTVFFNQITGETLGVSLSEQQLLDLLANGEVISSVPPEELRILSRMLKLPGLLPRDF